MYIIYKPVPILVFLHVCGKTYYCLSSHVSCGFFPSLLRQPQGILIDAKHFKEVHGISSLV